MMTRPRKKSDANKKWMKERKGRGISIGVQSHLIVSEGTKTEPEYFSALAELINSNSFTGRNGQRQKESIRFKAEGTGANTTGVLDRAKKIREEWEQELGFPVSHVWIVYDKDDFPSEAFNSVPFECEKLSQEGATKYHAIWSNQCFELWFLLHFEFMQSDLHRDAYKSMLNADYRNAGIKVTYKKRDKKTFERLLPYLPKAIKNSKTLLGMHEPDLTPTDKAPATMVYQIYDELKPYMPE